MFTVFCELEDGRECEVSKEGVAACADPQVLREQLAIFVEAKEELRPSIKFAKEIGRIPGGLEYKYRMYSTAEHWLRVRLRELVGGSDEDRLRNTIAELQAGIKKRDQKIAVLEAIVREHVKPEDIAC